MADNPVSVKDMTPLSSLNDSDLLYIIRNNGSGSFSDYNTLMSTLKTKIKSETSNTVSVTGSIPVNVDIILLTIGLSVANLVLPDGVNNQELLIVGSSLSSNAIITPTNFTNTSITFTLAGQTIKLKFIGTKWYIISNNGTTIN